VVPVGVTVVVDVAGLVVVVVVVVVVFVGVTVWPGTGQNVSSDGMPAGAGAVEPVPHEMLALAFASDWQYWSSPSSSANAVTCVFPTTGLCMRNLNLPSSSELFVDSMCLMSVSPCSS
jgi:hypothetical protein